MTTASYLPEFKIGSQQNVSQQDGAEVAGEALEMPQLGRGNKLHTAISSPVQYLVDRFSKIISS